VFSVISVADAFSDLLLILSASIGGKKQQGVYLRLQMESS